MKSLRLCALLAVVLSAGAASAAPPAYSSGDHWSVVSGETVSPNRDAIEFLAGWPGITFGYLHGLSDRSDVGFQFDLLYAYENTDSSRFGFGFNVPFRIVANRSGKVILGLHIEPGLRVYTGNNQTDLVLRFPVGGTLGIQATPELKVGAGIDLQMGINTTNSAFLGVGPLFGFQAEYAVDRQLDIGLHMRFGPEFFTYTGAGNPHFQFQTLVAVGYRL